MSTVIQLLLDKQGFPNNHLPVLVDRQTVKSLSLSRPGANAMRAETINAAPVIPHCTHAPQHQHSNVRHMSTAQALHNHMDQLVLQELKFLGLQSFCSHNAISYLGAHKHGEGDNGG